MPANIITSHFKFQLNHAKSFQDMNLQKLTEFLRLFSSFRKGVKVAIKHKDVIRLH